MKYKIVSGRMSHVQKEVNRLLEEGWELRGDLFATGNRITLSGDSFYAITWSYTRELAQVMVKSE